ncbi:MAG: DUF2891 domain-containing protein [Lentimicrobiaceae bacterium]|nr:DUF2891 domain-containing protein [Lentimicrobiaceae bacterium]MCO5265048.1 DUF2891 domain-containing protein [Lentimicrobium sp.]
MKYIIAILLMFWAGNSLAQQKLTEAKASHFSKLALKCIQQEYPNKPGEVVGSKEDIKPVREYRPAFYGCYDWHSSVHGHWMLIKLLKQYPDIPEALQIKDAIKKNITPENIAVEVNFFLDSNNKSFERTYGWAWLLKLAEELHTWDNPDGREWEAALFPLSNLICQYYLDFLPKLVYPIRVGEHSNTAFGLSFALDYARTTQNKALEALIIARARDFYLNDQNCPESWEPSGYDFLSPCLIEADLMARVLPDDEFLNWINAFLPGINTGSLKIMTETARVGDRSDGKLVHLDGLNFSRAWCLKHLAAKSGLNQEALITSAQKHLEAALPNVADGDYAGEHWLATFAVMAMDTE